jgi:predicted transcriptional regulator
MKKVMEQVMSAKKVGAAVEAIMADVSTSKSGKMKAMFNLGMEVKEIALVMGVRYNFVYNVVSNMVIVEGVEVENTKKASKKDAVWELLNVGQTVKEIAITLKTNYNYIYKLKKEWELEVAQEAAKLDEVAVSK